MEKNSFNLDNIFFFLQREIATGGLIAKDILDIKYHEIFFVILYFLFFLLFIKYFVRTQKINKFRSNILILYHFTYVLLAYIYSITNVNDLDTFFQYSYFLGDSLNEDYISNISIIKIYYILIYYLNLSYFSIYIFFGL